jgi:Choline dehydrogenase and related flavoproteins
MGRKNNTMAVIDNHANVYVVQGLKVVDASSFPFLPPSHPQSIVYAFAQKITDEILGFIKWMKINVDEWWLAQSLTEKSLYLFNDTLHYDNK